MLEVVTVVGVGHQHEFPACGKYAALQCAAVTFIRDMNYARPLRFGDLHRPIGRPVIADDYFTVDSGFPKTPDCFAYASAHSLSIVQTRHDDGQLDLFPSRD